MEALHTLFSYYGPRNPPWPRILVIGQEPNTELPVGDQAGPYELDAPYAVKVSFWTWSHKAVERAAAIPGLDLRRTAIKVKSSPIAYSDASPVSVSVWGGARGNKPGVAPDKLRHHAQNLLSLRELAGCSVVIISGRKREFATFYDTLERGLLRDVIRVDVPFFGRCPGSTADRLKAPLCTLVVRPSIKAVVEAWAKLNGVF